MADKPKGPPLPYPLGEREGAKVRKDAEQTAIGPGMPIDPSMTVDKLRVAQWLESHWHSPTRTAKSCPVCGTTKWAIADNFTWMAMVGSGGSLTLGGDYYPFVVLTCTYCGNTLLFNARVMGLLPLKKSEGA